MDGDLLGRQVGMRVDFVCSAMLDIVYLLRIRRPARVEVSPYIAKAQRTGIRRTKRGILTHPEYYTEASRCVLV